jgi:hypothetical protein
MYGHLLKNDLIDLSNGLGGTIKDLKETGLPDEVFK